MLHAGRALVILVPLVLLGACTAAHECGAPACAGDAATDREVDTAVIGGPDSVTVVMRTGPGWPLNFRGASSIVVFHDEAGLPIEVLHADADGIASSTRPGIAAVTVAPGYESSLLTILGVVRGDTLRFEPGFVHRQFVAPAPPADATTFARSTACSISTAASSTPYASGCVGEGPTNLLLRAWGTSGRYYLAMFDGPDDDPVLLGPWRDSEDVESIPCALTGPAGASDFVSFAHVATPYGWGIDAGQCRDGALALVRGIPATSHIVVEAWADLGPSTQVGASVALTEEQRASGFSIDLSATPRITSTTTDSSDLEHVSVSWTATGEYAVARLALDPEFYGDAWDIVAPAPVTRIELPTLPDEIASFRPVPGETTWRLILESTPEARDYASFKSHPIGPRDALARVGTRAFTPVQTF